MKIRYIAIIFLAAFLIQGSFLNLFSVFGVTPNLLLCLVAVLSFLYEDKNVIFVGVVFGLLSDLCSGEYLGIAALGYLVVSLAVSTLSESINKENAVSVIIVSIGATLLCNSVYFLISAGFGSCYSFMYWLKLQPAYILYNGIVIFILYMIFIKKVVRFRNDRYLTWRR